MPPAAERKPRMSRDEVRKHLAAGGAVAVGDTVHRADALTRRPEPPLPAPPPGRDDEGLEAVVVRDTRGNLTREGALHAFARGGSVMIAGRHYLTADDLPDDLEEEYERAADEVRGDRGRLLRASAALMPPAKDADEPEKPRGRRHRRKADAADAPDAGDEDGGEGEGAEGGTPRE